MKKTYQTLTLFGVSQNSKNRNCLSISDINQEFFNITRFVEKLKKPFVIAKTALVFFEVNDKMVENVLVVNIINFKEVQKKNKKIMVNEYSLTFIKSHAGTGKS